MKRNGENERAVERTTADVEDKGVWRNKRDKEREKREMTERVTEVEGRERPRRGRAERMGRETRSAQGSARSWRKGTRIRVGSVEIDRGRWCYYGGATTGTPFIRYNAD